MIEVCCRDCDKRYAGCHDECNDFLEFKVKKKKVNDKERQYKSNVSAGWNGYHKRTKKKIGEL